ncbi:MAG: hypothetical protein ACOC1G_01325 [Phycisphaeraceae bacterium]
MNHHTRHNRLIPVMAAASCFAVAMSLPTSTPLHAAPIDGIALHNDSNGNWAFDFERSGGSPDLTSAHGGDVNGGISDIPVVGDWDDDGLDEIGILRAGGSNFTVWRWLLSGTADGYEDDPVSGFTKTDFIHGNTATDIPVIGDWNNSGVQTVGLVRDNGSNLQWILSNSVAGASDITFTHGNSGDLAVVGDWDGDGYDTAGLVRENSGNMRWLLTNNVGSDGIDALDRTTGDFANDLTVTGDWNGDGKDSIGFYRPSTGEWFLPDNLTDPVTPADVEFSLSGATQAFSAVVPIPEPGSAALAAAGVLIVASRRWRG